ncbi:flagellar filament capping protein FliD [Melioribacter sp. OK-6-Me]|uniref:flagellar filament capping protein FliD n=1 Tax=unclassified Melioribacter TaxID=2627329 RepID=UPI003ED8FBA9
MAYDILTTSGINNLVNSYITNETQKRVTPLTTRKTSYENIVSAYSTISSKLDLFKSLLNDLKSTASDSIFYSKAASSSNTDFVTAVSNTGATEGNNTIRINQLAKNDAVLSIDLSSSAASAVITAPGTHEFTIKTGDGEGGEFISKISVTFDAADFTSGYITNETLMTKIQNAINTDKAIVLSNSVTGSTASSGSFVVDLNGTETTINYSAGTYSDVLDSIVTQLNDIDGITAEKIVNGSDYQLKITVNDSSEYITIKNDTGTLLTELGVSVTKEKGASGLVNASVFTPSSGSSQLRITAQDSGYDYRITDLSDTGSGTALAAVGLNLGATRQSFVQNSSVGDDTPGYIYSTDLLNAKLNFNGVNVERNSNVITDLISGTTITLKSVMQSGDADVNISVTKDVSKIKDKINEFITKFNDLYSYLREQTKTTETSRGSLRGDATASTLISLLNTVAYSAVDGIASNKINTLSKIGITFNIDSGLSLSDSDQLESAIEDNLDQVIELFTSTSGIATKLYDSISPYLGADGYIAKTKSTYDSTISSLSESIEAAQTRIDKYAESLRLRYQKLQVQLASIISSQNYFSLFSSSTTGY